MMRRFIPVEEVAGEWFKDPEFRTAYDALEDEFALASALIDARGRAGLIQAELARRMEMRQAVIVRLEAGWVKTPTRTLQRFANATGTRLRTRLR